MNSLSALIVATLCFPFVCGAQEQNVLPLNSEPHHHLILHNDYVNVYSVQVPPHDFVLLHKHGVDAIGIMLNDAEITVRAPGKPDSHQKVMNGQLRLQSAGYVHSTTIDGDAPYRNVTVELLATQQAARNLCAVVIAGQPTDCPQPSVHPEASVPAEEPQFRTGQTRVTLIRIHTGQSAALDIQSFPQLIVVLDDVSAATGTSSGGTLRTGDFLWRDANTTRKVFTNNGAKDVRLVVFAFQREKSAE
jgi:hypothetical protein